MTQSSDASGREPETVPPAGVSSRGRWARIGSVIAALLVLAVVAWLVWRPGHTPAQRNDAPAARSEVADVLVMLQRHGRALIERDAAQWSADLDPDASSAGFAQGQRQVFANLAQVPLKTWRYSLSSAVTSPDALTSAADRLHGRVVLVRVRLEYALADVDPAPTSKDLWLTAVQRGGLWRLASDSDVATTGGTSWHGPWDFGPLVVRRGPHTLVLAHPAHAADLDTFAGLVEQSVPVVTRVWGTTWNSHVAVLIPDSETEFAAVAGDLSDIHDLAAVAVADDVTTDGAVLGARIILNPASLARLDAAGRRLVVQHELTHIATRATTSDRMPTWVIEGFADYVGNLDSGQSDRTAAAELAAEVATGKVPAGLPTTADFSGSNARLPQIYEESWLACRLIARRAGEHGLVRFYKAVSIAAATAGDASAAGLRRVLNLSAAEFTAAWRAELLAELR